MQGENVSALVYTTQGLRCDFGSEVERIFGEFQGQLVVIVGATKSPQ